MSSSLGNVTANLNAGFALLIPLVLSVACWIWWRRVKHWSFGILCLALLLYWLPQLLVYLDAYTHLQEPFTSRRILFYTALALFQSCVVGTLILIGGWGLIVAGRK